MNVLRACRLAWPILRGWGSRDPGSNPGRPTNQFEDVRLFGAAWQMGRKEIRLHRKGLINLQNYYPIILTYITIELHQKFPIMIMINSGMN